MGWRPYGAKPLSKAMVTQIDAHFCVTRPQTVKTFETYGDVYKIGAKPLYKALMPH